jgi:uncharacterized protein (TIGR02444 family)
MRTLPSLDSEAAWNGVVALYADPATASELLRRQDAEGLDVTLHLFALWAAAQGIALDGSALADAEARVATWRAEVMLPLRALRRAMKTMQVTGPDRSRLAAVRSQVQAAELAAERAQVEMLCEWLRTR